MATDTVIAAPTRLDLAQAPQLVLIAGGRLAAGSGAETSVEILAGPVSGPALADSQSPRL
jgi:hypothetical protein